MLLPILTNARVIKSYQIGSYYAALVTDAQSPGPINYVYVLAIVKNGEQAPCFYVTSEVNLMKKEMMQFASKKNPALITNLDEIDYDSPYLCTFTQDGTHMNMGQSAKWADMDSFTDEALSIALKQFEIKMSQLKSQSIITIHLFGKVKNISFFCNWNNHCSNACISSNRRSYGKLLTYFDRTRRLQIHL